MPNLIAAIILTFFSLTNCIAQPTKKIAVNYSRNIETLSIICNLAKGGQSNFKNHPQDRSVIARLITKEFSLYAYHPAVIKTNELIEKGIIDSYDNTLALYYTELPEFKKLANLQEIYYQSDEYTRIELQEIFTQYFSLIKQFYNDAKVEAFLNKYKYIYTKAIRDYSKALPPSNYLPTIEKYYGIKFDKYQIIPSITMFSGTGKAELIVSKRRTYSYFIQSPQYEIDTINSLSQIDTSENFGFADVETNKRLGVHEFGHSFFRFDRDSIERNLIKKIEFLNTKALQRAMQKQGYGGDWNATFDEFLVRTGEIRIAALMGDKQLSQELYNDYINKKGFIYIPELLSIYKKYERNRRRYKTIKEYFPVIIQEMQKVTVK